MAGARAWLTGVAPSDPMERRHAPSVLVLCALGFVALVTGEIVRFLAGELWNDLAVSAMRLIGAAVLLAAFLIVRGGRFKRGVSLFVAGAVLISAAGVALTGLSANSRNLTEFTLPLALAALLVGRRALWISMAAYAAGFTIGGLRDDGYLWGSGPQPPPTLPFGDVGTAIIGFLVVAIVLDRVGLSLREGFELALLRQRELEQKSAELAEANDALEAEMARRHAAEARLLEAQKMEAISRLSGGVAHDFNNLLTVILGSTQMSQEALPPEHPANAMLNEVREAAQRAADLTRQLLAFARRQIIEPKVLSLDERVRSMQKLLARLLREDIVLHTDLGAASWNVRIDPGQLDQVLVNLVVNARDAMPDGGPLTIRTREVAFASERVFPLCTLPAGDYVLLEIEDRGTGMDPETSRRIFEPFFTTKGGVKGTGLGLATCYGIVAQAGGVIVFETKPGEGTRFQIYLPRSSALTLEQQGSTESSPTGARGETVLVVEDEAAVRRIVVRVLRRAGYQVLDATSLAGARELVEAGQGSIDLLVTDLVLPDGGGAAVAEAVSRAYPKIRVLYVSGYTDDDVVRQGILKSEVAFLSKPFTSKSLLARVREVLDGR